MPYVVTLPKVVDEKLSHSDRENVINFINELLNHTKDDVKFDVIQVVEEKFERRLIEEISKVKVEIANTKAEIIKWMFIFWLGNIISILGGIFALLKLAKVF